MKGNQCLIFAIFSILFISSACTKCNNNYATNKAKLATDSNKKIFSFARSADPRTIDPQAQLDSLSATFINSLYDTLITYHYLKRPYSMTPLLLTKMPELSKDKLTYTFTLRSGIKFIDDPCFSQGKGRELTSEDVIYTLKRFADAKVNTQSWFLLADAIKGLDDFRAMTSKSKEPIDYWKHNISGLTIVNKHVFKIHLTRENPLVLFAFPASSLSIVSHEAVKKYGTKFNRYAVGTGPFKLVKYRKKQTMVLVKNPNYFERYPNQGSKEDEKNGLLAAKGSQLPLVDEVHLLFIPEAQPEMLKFKKGELAWVGMDRDNFTKMAYLDLKGNISLKEGPAQQFTLYTEPSLASSYMPINMKDPLLGKNRYLRLAIASVINIEKKIAILANGRGVKLNTIVPLSISGSEKNIGNYGFTYDLTKAKAYLKQAGYPNGKGLPPIKLTLAGSSTAYRDYYEFMRNSLNKIGIKLVADYKTWSAYLRATESGNFQISASAWAADYPDAENFYMLFYGPNKPPGQNSSGFDHTEYNKLYDTMKYMPNSPARFATIKKMAAILQHEVPVIFDSNTVISGLIQKWVKNFKRNVMVSRPFKYFDIDTVAQKKFIEMM